jgi:Family of unknown function (DUF6023)
VVLYGCTAAVLAGGGTWWVAAAPEARTDRQIEQWRAAAEKLLPEDGRQEDVDTVALPGGAEHEVLSNVSNGEHTVSVACVGSGDSVVRVSLGDGGDSGRGLRCADDGHPPDTFAVAVAGQIRMNVNVSDNGPVVFRYVVIPGDD